MMLSHPLLQATFGKEKQEYLCEYYLQYLTFYSPHHIRISLKLGHAL